MGSVPFGGEAAELRKEEQASGHLDSYGVNSDMKSPLAQEGGRRTAAVAEPPHRGRIRRGIGGGAPFGASRNPRPERGRTAS